MAQKKVWAQELQVQFDVSVVKSCKVVKMSRKAYYYKPKLVNDEEIIDVLNALVEKHHRWGFPKCFKRLRKLGHRWNHKRVHRVYTELKLNLRRKTKRRLPARHPEPLAVPCALGKSWSMDFMSDSLHNKIRFRTFNVIDDFNREVLGIDVATSMPSLRVVRYLDQVAEWHGYPERIRVDNGSEFTSSVFTDWAKAHGIKVDYIQPGCPYQNAYVERFNRTYRDEILDCYIFNNLNEVKQFTEEWIEIYNNERPHDSLNDMTPIEFRNAA